MKNISRRMLIGSLSLIFLNSACGPGPTPVPMETIFPGGQIQTVAPTSTGLTSSNSTSTSTTPLIPVTGHNVVSMQCQFCVDTVAHAILIFPDFAFFDVAASEPVTCLTAHVVNGQRVLICRGAELTTFTLNICSDPSNCLQFPVTLDACPLIPNTGIGTPGITFTPVTPFFLNPENTLRPPTSEPAGLPTSTVASSLPPPISTTAPPPPTFEPPPPSTTEPPPPPPTDPPSTDDHGPPDRKPSNTPRPDNTRRP